ncbi:MAG: LytTR family DNA-binding domain-containing protein [Pseudomonadota bacterium]
MDNRQSSFALRELRAQFGNRRVLVVLAGIGVILGVVGPYRTGEVMLAAPRIVYWMAIVFVSYAVGSFTVAVLGRLLDGPRVPPWARVVAQGIAIGVMVAPVVLVINWIVFGIVPEGPPAVVEFVATVCAVTLVIAVAFELYGDTAEEARVAAPAILQRLPVAQRGTLLSLSGEDHYVRVRTDRGEEMVLMRLADAIAEAAPVAGLQVHRSHWVARDAVAAARRSGERAILTLTSGDEIPVSRANVRAVREAGLL